ncbi:MAG: hypothetical protein ACRDRJ_13930 [Streptosporangiaceae bacterium]
MLGDLDRPVLIVCDEAMAQRIPGCQLIWMPADLDAQLRPPAAAARADPGHPDDPRPGRQHARMSGGKPGSTAAGPGELRGRLRDEADQDLAELTPTQASQLRSAF